MIEKNEPKTESSKVNQKKAFTRLALITIIIFLCLFGSAGTLSWWNGWLFMASYILVLLTLTGFVLNKNPDLVAERMNAAGKAKPWDRIIVPVLALVLPLLSVVLAGLDHRFAWTAPFRRMVIIIAFTIMIIGNALTFLAMKTNPFFSSHVRIQDDRGHRVISSGPYRFVRHPGYTGSILYNMAVPIFLESFPALWVGIAFSILMVFRTILEDRTLKTELPGYREYADQVRRRLIPFIW